MMRQPAMRPAGTAKNIGRSLRIYHGPDAPKAAMDTLYAQFVRSGDLVFDIGAHVGDRVSSFRRLGAMVVALEPQQGPMRALQLIHGRDPNVTLLPLACGPVVGEVTFSINSANPTVSTASPAFIAAADGASGWETQVWDTQQVVAMTTLDALVAIYGLPAFVKIDVEGYEADVLNGLSHQLPALSFEFTTIQRGVLLTCLEQINQMGRYQFNVALGENQKFIFDKNIDYKHIMEFSEKMPFEFNSGDIYCFQQNITVL